jgi:hypothetical protein
MVIPKHPHSRGRSATIVVACLISGVSLGAVAACTAPTSEAPSGTTATDVSPAAEMTATINSIIVEDGSYVVDYSVTGFPHNNNPDTGVTHVHFFFDTVPIEEAGVPGSGDWELYGGPNPFTEYTVEDRPEGAEQMCVLVANSDHTVQAGTGNCMDLPSSQ